MLSPNVVIAGLDRAIHAAPQLIKAADWTQNKPMRSIDRRVKPGGDEAE